MRSPSTSGMLWGAGLILVSGCIGAARIWDDKPQAAGPDLRNLQHLAASLDREAEAAPALDFLAPANRTSPPPVKTAPVSSPVRLAMPPTPARPRVQPEPRRTTAPSLPPVVSPPPAVPVADDAVKNVALMGVTFADGKDAAWLMDLGTRNRETAAVGESVLGFTVKEIEPDRVLLTRGGRDYSLRLGEKPILVASASPVSVASAGGDAGGDDAPFGFGPGGPGGRGGAGGRFAGGPGGRFAGGPGGFGGFGGAGGAFGNRGGGGFGGGSGFSAPGLGSSTTSNSGGGGRGGFTPQAGGFGGGGFAGGGFGGGGFGQSFGGGTSSSTSSGASGSTSNPQTARRQGSRLSGDADPVEQPAAIVNPQTQRRTGSSNQPAFGQADTTVRGQTGSGSRTGSGSTGSR